MYHGAPVNCLNKRMYTPLFMAAKAGSLCNIIELVEHGADVNHCAESHKCKDLEQKLELIGKTPLYRASTYESALLLLKYGANPHTKTPKSVEDSQNESVFGHFLKYNTNCARAILDECLSKEAKDNLIMDFTIFDFKSGADNENKMAVSNELPLLVTANQFRKNTLDAEQARKSLLMHPIMQTFLKLKFKTVRPIFLFQIMLQIILVLTITALGIYYVELTNCSDNDIDTNCFIIRRTGTNVCENNISTKHLHSGPINSILNCENGYIRLMNNSDHVHVLEPICNAQGESIEECWTQH